MAKRHRTPAYKEFLGNMADVRRLLQIHGQLSGAGPGRRWGTEVLNKSAVVLLIACWEAYLEDIVSFAFDTTLTSCQEPRHFAKDVINRIGQSVRDAKDERAIWSLAGSGWRGVFSDYKKKRIEKFHNPHSGSVDEFFQQVLGIKGISKCWHWTGMSADRARKKLDQIVGVRGSIAHRVQHATPLHLAKVRDYQGHVRRLVRKTDSEIRRSLKIK